jgi:hypothetical protein
MATHAEHNATEGVDTSEVNHVVVVSFVVVFSLAVMAAYLIVVYLFQFLVALEDDKKNPDDPQVVLRHTRDDGAEAEAIRTRYLVVKGPDGKTIDKRDYPVEKQINDPDWQEYKVAMDRILVQGIPRAKLPPEPTLESADVLNPLHSGAVRDPFTLGHENIKAGEKILSSSEGNRMPIENAFSEIVKKGVIKKSSK